MFKDPFCICMLNLQTVCKAHLYQHSLGRHSPSEGQGSGGNTLHRAAVICHKKMRLSEILQLPSGDRLCFSDHGHCQEKPTLPHGPYWKITSEREER